MLPVLGLAVCWAPAERAGGGLLVGSFAPGARAILDGSGVGTAGLCGGRRRTGTCRTGSVPDRHALQHLAKGGRTTRQARELTGRGMRTTARRALWRPVSIGAVVINAPCATLWGRAVSVTHVPTSEGCKLYNARAGAPSVPYGGSSKVRRTGWLHHFHRRAGASRASTVREAASAAADAAAAAMRGR